MRVPPNDVDGIWKIFKSIVVEAIALHIPWRVINAKVANRYLPYTQRAIRPKRTLRRNRSLRGRSGRYNS